MRIGIDASRAFGPERTGTEEYSYQMIKHLLGLPEAREHEWVLYTRHSEAEPKNPDWILHYVQDDKVRVINIRNKYLWTQVGLAARTWVDKLDILWVPAHTLPVLRRPGLATVVTIHGIEYEWLPAYENALQRWYLPLSTKYAVLSAKKIIAVSEFTKKQLVERLGAEEKKIKVIYEGTGSFSFDSAQDQDDRSRHAERSEASGILKKFDLKPKRYLLFVGTVQPRKNLERLIRAFSSGSFGAPQDDKLRLVIAGKLGWNYQEVVELAKKHNVLVTGYISETERDSLLRNALVYVQPSITEGFGLPIIEAMRAGVPVVSSNGGALPEVVGDAGLLFDPYNIENIRTVLEKVIKDVKLQKSLIELGKKRVEEFSWQKAAMETYSYLTSSYSV